MNKDTFLKLLVAQLKYQNPLSPADPTQFMAQTAQFTMVEELQNMAKDQKASALSQQLSTASSIVGKQVTYLDTNDQSQTGVVTSAKISNGSTMLVIGTTEVPIEAVQEIAPAPAATTSIPEDPTTTDPAATDPATDSTTDSTANQNTDVQDSAPAATS